MELQRPICVFDLETTGLNRENDRIVEISVVKMLSTDPGTWQTKTKRLNPQMPIPPQVSAVHGITDEMVAGCSTFERIANSLHQFITGCDIGGFGCLSFDVPVLYNEFARAGITWDYQAHHIVDAGNLFKIKEPRDLSAALWYYCQAELEDAHSAEADAKATAMVLCAQMRAYEDLDRMPISELAIYSNYGHKILDVSGKFVYNDAGQIIINFGPPRGKPALENLDFVHWMTTKEFPADTMRVCYELLNQ